MATEEKSDAASTSPIPIRVLLLEDDPSDAKLISKALERGGYQVQFEVTDTPEVFRKSLEDSEPDVILADFNLRSWTAFDALDILKRSGKNVPLIVVTGTLGDEAAVECIKYGAADFVLKDRTARLPAAIEGAREDKRLRAENQRAFDSISRLATIVESSADAIVGATLQGVITSWNKGAEKLYGYAPSEILGLPASTLLPADRLDEVTQILASLGRGVPVEQFETVRVRKDKSLVDVSLSVFTLTNTRGEVTGAASIARDITVRKWAEQKAERLARQMKSILEAAGEGIYGVDSSGILTFVNPAATRILGYASRELIGRHGHAIFHHTRPDGTEYPAADCPLADIILRTGVASQGEDWFWRKDGTGFPVQLSATPMKNSGEVVGAVVTFNDITERKRTEESLVKRTQELERSNTELQQFAYVSSHDLQEPLRTMASFAELLQRRYLGKLDANADDFIRFIVDGATRMQGLINALLAYSRVGSGGHEFALADCGTALQEALANLEMAISESGATITRGPLPTIPCYGAQLAQVFQNLVGNSIKFRGSNPLHVHVAAEQSSGEWIFSVKDTGIGIEPQYADRIFEVFQRLHKVAEYPGSGIGLAIAKKIVERHGGRIWVESQPQQGATFLFTLPAGNGA